MKKYFEYFSKKGRTRVTGNSKFGTITFDKVQKSIFLFECLGLIKINVSKKSTLFIYYSVKCPFISFLIHSSDFLPFLSKQMWELCWQSLFPFWFLMNVLWQIWNAMTNFKNRAQSKDWILGWNIFL